MNSSEWLLLEDMKKQIDQLVQIAEHSVAAFKKYEPILEQIMQERGLS